MSQLRDPDIPKEGYLPQSDGVEYVLAIRIDFSDQPGQKPASDFNEAIFGTRGSSVRLYYEEVSYGQMHILPGYLGGVVPEGRRWYRARKKMSYYGEGNIMTARYKELAAEACAAADPDVDFSRYDRDGDGYVDHLMIIHAGDDEASTGIPDDIWSASIDMVSGVYDGVRIPSVMMLAEDPSNDVINIGIYSHEFFHEFGAPDLYLPTWEHPVGHWGLMGTFGPYQDNGQHPSHISGYLKWDFDANPLNGVMGWLQPINLTSSGTYSVDSFELPTGNRLYKIDIPGKMGKEYFLVENRNKRSGAIYDTYLPESGIVIWHIDENQPSFGSLRKAWVEDPTDPDHSSSRKATEGAAYSADDGQTSFTPATQPDSSANDGNYSGIIITDIGSEGMSMPFTFFSGDTYEPNGSIADAYGPLAYGRQYLSYIRDDHDIDFYRFHADTGNIILIYLEDIPENSNYDLQIFDTQERLVDASTELSQTAEVLSFRTQTAGTYYVAVISRSGYDSEQPYSLTVDSSPLAPGMIALSKVYPNPGGEDGVWFDYKLLAAVESITLDIYTPTGTLIYTHSTPAVSITGRLFWDAKTDTGERIASGIYIYILKAYLNGETDTKIGKIAIVY
jgi:M6 family metalloprotease-like protein